MLPPGVTVGPGRETSQPGANGQMSTGIVVPITLPNGTVTTMFFTYSELTSAPQSVSDAIATRVNAIQALTGA